MIFNPIAAPTYIILPPSYKTREQLRLRSLWSKCLGPPPPSTKLYAEMPAPKVMGSGGGAFERRLVHEGGPLMNGTNVLTKDLRARPHPFHRASTQ